MLNFVAQFVPYRCKCNSLDKINMVSTRMEKQQNKKFFRHLDKFDGDVIFGDDANNRQQCAIVNNGYVGREIPGQNNDSTLTIN